MKYNHFYFQNVCVGEGTEGSPKWYGVACLCGAIRNGGRRSVFGFHQKWQCRVSIGIKFSLAFHHCEAITKLLLVKISLEVIL